jgi:hypothetical protein
MLQLDLLVKDGFDLALLPDEFNSLLFFVFFIDDLTITVNFPPFIFAQH